MSADYPTISSSIPVYNVLIDFIEDMCDERVKRKKPKTRTKPKAMLSDPMICAAKATMKKLCDYYSMTDGLAYTCATCEFQIVGNILLISTMLGQLNIIHSLRPVSQGITRRRVRLGGTRHIGCSPPL